MSKRERLFPINDSWRVSERIRANVPFPVWVEDERVGINVYRTERLMQLGGIRHARLTGKTGKENSSVSIISVAGVGPDGSIYAGRVAASKKAPTYKVGVDHNARHSGQFFHNFVWDNANIELDMGQIGQEINEDGGDLRKAESWVPHLDTVLRGGIRKAGTEHLLRGHNKFRALSAFFININNSLLAAADMSMGDAMLGHFSPHVPIPAELASRVVFSTIFWNLWMTVFCGAERSGRGYRISLFPGYEVDRAVALQIFSRAQKLIKTIDNE